MWTMRKEFIEPEPDTSSVTERDNIANTGREALAHFHKVDSPE